MAAYRPLGDVPRLQPMAFERRLTSDDLLEYLRPLPAARVPRVVALDNAGIHLSRTIKARRNEPPRQEISL